MGLLNYSTLLKRVFESQYWTTAISRLKMIFEQWQSRTYQSPHALYCCKNELSAASTCKHLRPRPASLVYYCRHCPQLLTTHLKQEVIGPGMRSFNISEGGNLRGQTTCLLLLGGDLSAVHGKSILAIPGQVSLPAPSVWSKTTLNTGGAGGAGASPPTCKSGTFFLIPLNT